MTQIVLNSEQAAILSSADHLVAICRPDGSIAGFVSPQARLFAPEKSPFTSEEVAAALREAKTTTRFSTTKEVLSRLKGQEKS